MDWLRFKSGSLLSICGFISACGTTYTMPGIAPETTSRASAMFAEAQAAPPRQLASPGSGVARFERVAARVGPVARKLCESELTEDKGIDCNVALQIDPTLAERNAYFTYSRPGNEGPVIRFSIPILQDAASDDEVAFILGHEYGHLIGQHIVKQQQQAIAGAIILGAIAAYGNASAASAGQYYDPNAVSDAVDAGAAIGQQAFSQTYELESEMLGTRIAYAAGYDPIKGAQFFCERRGRAIPKRKAQLLGHASRGRGAPCCRHCYDRRNQGETRTGSKNGALSNRLL